MFKITVALLLDVESEAEACDAMNEILRVQQRSFTPSSCLLDYQIDVAPEETSGIEFFEYADAPA